MNSNLYINGAGIISPQVTFEESFLPSVQEYTDNILLCITPDFKEYINPIQLRRLSRMLRIGLSAATISLRDAGINVPDGIITATGYGFLNEAAKFLHEILEQQEKHLTPTHFMQSTYNALAGLVALSVKCMGYNNTYVSKGFSFENALHDSMIQLQDHYAATFLVGGYDEASDVQYKANLRAGHYKPEKVSNLKLFESSTTGTLQGEGAAFFVLSNKPSSSTRCELVDVETIYRPRTSSELAQAVMDFLQKNQLAPEAVNLWIDGSSGDTRNDALINSVGQSLLTDAARVRFKHLCGEYCTASAFALWLGATILRNQTVPECVKVGNDANGKPLKTILILNHYMGRNYSLILLRKN